MKNKSKDQNQDQNDKYILGGGLAGLITGYYHPDYKIIVQEPMGQENKGMSLGPRILQYDPGLYNFVYNLFGSRVTLDKINIGFEDQEIHQEPPEGFREEYSFRTRGTRIINPSFMSSGQTEIEVISIDHDPDTSFNKLTRKLYSLALENDQILIDTITKIDKHSLYGQNKYDFTKLYCTVPLNVFNKIYSIELLNPDILKLGNKNYILCSYDNPVDKANRDKYSYIYGLSDWTRKTYTDNIVYEVQDDFDPDRSDIDGNNILKKLSLPMQIKNNLNFKQYNNIYFVGRLGTWNHGILTNQIVEEMENGG